MKTNFGKIMQILVGLLILVTLAACSGMPSLPRQSGPQ